MKQLLYLALFFVVTSCSVFRTTQKTVTLPQTRIEIRQDTFVYHDTTIMRDTFNNTVTTIIRELDSVAMAEYGIQLASQQRAWLIDRQQLQQQVKSLQRTQNTFTAVHDTIRNTIPIPIHIENVKETESPWYDTILKDIGIASLVLLLVIGVVTKKD